MKEIKRTDKNMFSINERATCPKCSSKLCFAFHVTMEDEKETNEDWKYHEWDVYKCEKCGKTIRQHTADNDNTDAIIAISADNSFIFGK